MKGRHHLEWYRFRNHGTPDRRRRRDRLYSLERVIIAGTIGPTSATLVDSLDGRLVGNPPLLKLTGRGCALAKVLVELTSNPSHDLLETSQFVFEVLHGIMENIDGGILLPNYPAKVATLTKS